MRHLVQYHKAWEQGSPFIGERPFVFAKNSAQKRNLALQAVKDRDRIWLIYRNAPSETDYHVAFTFLATEVKADEDDVKIIGDEVVIPASLTLSRSRNSWFVGFMRHQGNFSFGLREVSSEYAPHFDSLLEKI
ncbi:hypothetical protein [Halomonas mongoliensis]|uniref:hypothetical protein n=1 Tax=Halomonas mongoliensis TaxID=321265 RepID=UPI00403AC64E